MLKLISGGILALGGAGLLGVLALGGAGFSVLGAAAGSPHTTLVLVCDQGVDLADVTAQLWMGDPSAGGVQGPTETISCGSGDRRNRQRVVTFNADFAVVTDFSGTRPTPAGPDNFVCATDLSPISGSLTLTATCPPGDPNVSLKIQ